MANLLVYCQDDFNRITAISPQILLALKQGLFSVLGVITFLTAHTLSRFAFPWIVVQTSLELVVAQLIGELADLVEHAVALVVLTVPLRDIVVGLLVLQPF